MNFYTFHVIFINNYIEYGYLQKMI